VRHNLSLNKCFEKIEKPSGNGSQRKGCLWAMNPSKMSKMDEEVQKWSRKDPQAIRRAMVIPGKLIFPSRSFQMLTLGFVVQKIWKCLSAEK
jgi:forkhead box protein N